MDCFAGPGENFPIMAPGGELQSLTFQVPVSQSQRESRGRLLFKGIMKETKQERSWPPSPEAHLHFLQQLQNV